MTPAELTTAVREMVEVWARKDMLGSLQPLQPFTDAILALCQRVQREERERCARIADEHNLDRDAVTVPLMIAAAIRREER